MFHNDDDDAYEEEDDLDLESESESELPDMVARITMVTNSVVDTTIMTPKLMRTR